MLAATTPLRICIQEICWLYCLCHLPLNYACIIDFWGWIGLRRLRWKTPLHTCECSERGSWAPRATQPITLHLLGFPRSLTPQNRILYLSPDCEQARGHPSQDLRAQGNWVVALCQTDDKQEAHASCFRLVQPVSVWYLERHTTKWGSCSLFSITVYFSSLSK